MSSVSMSHLLFPIVLVINTLPAALVYWLGYRFLGFGLITLGALIAFSQYIWMITEPVVNLSNFYNTALAAMTAAERIFEILDTEAKIVYTPRAYPIPEMRGEVEFQNVNFEYEEEKPIFKDPNFRAAPGETVALVGETGAGKSTIINLMTRFYDIQGGTRLSVGQKQLVAFARTLLYDPKILILDEATASIGTQTEVLLQKAVAYVLANRTSFVIAHRLSTIRRADRIVVIAHGKIIEQGDHEQLPHRGGKYFDLYKAQYHKVLS